MILYLGSWIVSYHHMIQRYSSTSRFCSFSIFPGVAGRLEGFSNGQHGLCSLDCCVAFTFECSRQNDGAWNSLWWWRSTLLSAGLGPSLEWHAWNRLMQARGGFCPSLLTMSVLVNGIGLTSFKIKSLLKADGR